MRKRITALLLAVLLTVLLLPAPALSAGTAEQFAAETGRVRFIDYGRVISNTTHRFPVGFRVGGRNFRGWVTTGKRLSNAEIDDIIRNQLWQDGVTKDELLRRELIEQRAKSIDPSFDPYVMFEIIGRFLGAGDAIDLAQGQSGTDILLGQLQGQTFSQFLSMAEGAVSGPALFVANGIANCGSAAFKRMVQRARMNSTLQKYADIAAEWAKFYKKVNDRILEAEEKQGTTGWKLICSGSDEVNKKFFGAATNQKWKLSCRMEQQGKHDRGDWTGTYKGDITIDISHDMANFDNGFVQNVVLKPGTPFSGMTGIGTFTDLGTMPSVLTKTVTLSNAEITLTEAEEGESLAELPLAGAKQDDCFFTDHPVLFAPDGVMGFLSSDGTFSFNVGNMGGEFSALYLYGGDIPDGRYPKLYLNEYNLTNKSHETIPYRGTLTFDSSSSGKAAMCVGTNYRIYDDLAVGTIVVSMGWKGGSEWVH